MRLPILIRSGSAAIAAIAALLATGAAWAQDNLPELPIIGAPDPGGVGFQPAATELAHDLHRLDYMLLVICTFVTLMVVALIIFVVLRFNAKSNPTPARFSHNAPLEVTWTVLPIIVLVFIGSFSLPTLFKQQTFPDGDIHIKVTGHQWFWDYEYTDDGVLFDSYMIGSGMGNLNADISADLAAAGYSDTEFRLAADNAMVVPVDKVVLLTLTGADVIHSWTVPAFGVKQDAVPGRLSQIWFAADEVGIYFGQCSELCGKDHAYMPITVKVVSQEDYDAWLEQAKIDHPSI